MINIILENFFDNLSGIGFLYDIVGIFIAGTILLLIIDYILD